MILFWVGRMCFKCMVSMQPKSQSRPTEINVLMLVKSISFNGSTLCMAQLDIPPKVSQFVKSPCLYKLTVNVLAIFFQTLFLLVCSNNCGLEKAPGWDLLKKASQDNPKLKRCKVLIVFTNTGFTQGLLTILQKLFKRNDFMCAA